MMNFISYVYKILVPGNVRIFIIFLEGNKWFCHITSNITGLDQSLSKWLHSYYIDNVQLHYSNIIQLSTKIVVLQESTYKELPKTQKN